MSKAAISIEGFIANDLQVRQVTGHRIVDVTVPVTPQKQVNGKWEDSGDTVWFKAAFWDEHGDGVLDTVQKGTLVTITGTPKLDLYLKQGEPAGSIVLEFPVIAVVVRKPKRGEVRPPVEEPWATTAPGSADVWDTPGQSYSEEVPF